MLEPSGTSLSALIPIFCLLDELLYLGMFTDGECGERIGYDAMRFLAPNGCQFPMVSYKYFEASAVGD